MGSIIKAYCDCGYENTMPLGGGMKNFTTYCNFPFFCEECRILFEENLFEEQMLCPKCKGTKTIPYDKKCLQKGTSVFEWNIGDRELTLTDGKYVCPECGNSTLTFEDEGCWD
jgi:Zn finger protein HypA/HybF involved in hydrogenase expression